MSHTGSTPKRQPRNGAAAGRETDVDPIAEGLKQLFRNVADEPVPDEFMDLLNRIDAATGTSPQ